jgi:protein phosphatase
VTVIGLTNGSSATVIPGHADTRLAITWAGVTDVGRRRKANEDSLIASAPIFAVADGMGGHLAGDRASDAVVSRLAELLLDDYVQPAQIERALERATQDIEIVSNGSELGVGTTVTGTVLTLVGGDPYFAVFNIGDSRVYAFEGNELTQVTVDHSLVQQLVDNGIITAAQAINHPEGNVITRAVGFHARPVPDYWMIPARVGLRLLICSDGLTGEVTDDRLRLHLAAGLSVDATANALVDAALASGGRDNITVVVLEVTGGLDDSAYTNATSRENPGVR